MGHNPLHTDTAIDFEKNDALTAIDSLISKYANAVTGYIDDVQEAINSAIWDTPLPRIDDYEVEADKIIKYLRENGDINETFRKLHNRDGVGRDYVDMEQYIYNAINVAAEGEQEYLSDNIDIPYNAYDTELLHEQLFNLREVLIENPVKKPAMVSWEDMSTDELDEAFASVTPTQKVEPLTVDTILTI